MSTRTAPSDRPRTPAISARGHLVDEAQDERPPAIAGQPADGAPGRGRPRRAATASASRSSGVGDVGRGLERRLGMAAPAGGGARPRRCGRSGTARRGTSRRPRRRPAGPAPRTGRGWSARRGTSARWRPPPRDGRAARRTRSCTPGRGTSDTGPRTGPGPPGPPRRADDRGRDGRGADRPPPDGPPSSMPDGPSRYTRAAIGVGQADVA